MNKTQIQALIDTKIAGQGNQVDSGGALATILNELNDGVAAVPEKIAQAKVEVEAEIPSFFEVTGVPNAGNTTVEALDSAGFTKANIAAAAEGKVLYIKMGNQHFTILQAMAQEGDEGSYSIEFLWNRSAEKIISHINVIFMGYMVFATVSDKSLGTPSPVFALSSVPTAGMTKEQIQALGFTQDIITQMAGGQITTITISIYGGASYPIKKAVYDAMSGQGTVVFSDLTYDATNSKWVGTQYTIITQENPTAPWSVAVDTLS